MHCTYRYSQAFLLVEQNKHAFEHSLKAGYMKQISLKLKVYVPLANQKISTVTCFNSTYLIVFNFIINIFDSFEV